MVPCSHFFSLREEGLDGESLVPEHWYHFHPEHGLVAAVSHDPSRPAYVGADLLAMADGEFGGEVRSTARRLMRQVLAVHLGDAPLRSRDLFRGRNSGAGDQA